jgi:outer membrane murein-binding lipoprotein Lpp
MADRIDDLTERVQTIEEKLDRLSTSVNQLSASVDQRFNAVDAAFIEQRQYTEFAYSRLEAKIDAGFGQIGRQVGRVERKLDQFIDVQLQTNQLVDRRLRANL